MTIIEFRGAGETGSTTLGRLIWDGSSIKMEPKGALDNILKQELYDSIDKTSVSFKDDPEAFLAQLPRAYRSPYLRAILIEGGHQGSKALSSEESSPSEEPPASEIPLASWMRPQPPSPSPKVEQPKVGPSKAPSIQARQERVEPPESSTPGIAKPPKPASSEPAYPKPPKPPVSKPLKPSPPTQKEPTKEVQEEHIWGQDADSDLKRITGDLEEIGLPDLSSHLEEIGLPGIPVQRIAQVLHDEMQDVLVRSREEDSEFEPKDVVAKLKEVYTKFWDMVGQERNLPPPGINREAKENLGKAKVRKRRSLQGGVNKSYILEFREGGQAVFKPKSGETLIGRISRRPLREAVRDDRYFLREVVASEIADLLGLGDLVPPTIVRRDSRGGRPAEFGSAQQFIPDAENAEEMPSGQQWGNNPHDVARAAAFDYLMGNTDRHDGNWMVKNGKIVLIDHGLGFPEHNDEFGRMGIDPWHGKLLYRASNERMLIPLFVGGWGKKIPQIVKLMEKTKVVENGEERVFTREEIQNTVQRIQEISALAGRPFRSYPRDYR